MINKKRACWIMGDRDHLTNRIIACCYKVHNELGPGFKERNYHNALKFVLNDEGLKYEMEKWFNVFYLNNKVGDLIVDLLVENKVIVEVKAVTGNIPDVFKYQVISYLKASKLKVGLLINFGNKSCQVMRLVN